MQLLKYSSEILTWHRYRCKFLEGDVNTHYDWSADVMNEAWNAKSAMAKLKAEPETLVCDALLDQKYH